MIDNHGSNYLVSVHDPHGRLSKLGSKKDMVIVPDYDRTLTNGALELYEPAMEALATLGKEHGVRVIVASGRKLDFLTQEMGRLAFVEAIVAENGAALYFPRSSTTVILGGDTSGVREALHAASIPIDKGYSVISTRRGFEEEVRKIVRDGKFPVELQYNLDSLMILPAGVNKATGVRDAINRLGLSDAEIICIGDGENDLPLLEMATIGVATENAVPEVKNAADIVCEGAYGVGVARFLKELSRLITRSRSEGGLVR